MKMSTDATEDGESEFWIAYIIAQCQSMCLFIRRVRHRWNSHHVLVHCEQKCFEQVPESGLGGVWVADRIGEAVQADGLALAKVQSRAAVHGELVPWYV